MNANNVKCFSQRELLLNLFDYQESQFEHISTQHQHNDYAEIS